MCISVFSSTKVGQHLKVCSGSQNQPGMKMQNTLVLLSTGTYEERKSKVRPQGKERL